MLTATNLSSRHAHYVCMFFGSLFYFRLFILIIAHLGRLFQVNSWLSQVGSENERIVQQMYKCTIKHANLGEHDTKKCWKKWETRRQAALVSFFNEKDDPCDMCPHSIFWVGGVVYGAPCPIMKFILPVPLFI